MNDKEFENKYMKYSSWAIWSDPSDGNWEGKTSIGEIDNMRIGDDIYSINEYSYSQLKSKDVKYIFVGLNPTSQSEIGKSYHTGDTADTQKSNDYKLRYAFHNTACWGAFLTDLFEEEASNESALREKVREKRNISLEAYAKERIPLIKDIRKQIGATAIVVAFGKTVYDLLKKDFEKEELIKIPHFSNFYYNARDYRSVMLTRLGVYGFDTVNELNNKALLCDCIKNRLGCSECPLDSFNCSHK